MFVQNVEEKKVRKEEKVQQRCSTAQDSSVHHSTALDTVHYSTAQHSTAQYCALQYGRVLYYAM